MQRAAWEKAGSDSTRSRHHAAWRRERMNGWVIDNGW